MLPWEEAAQAQQPQTANMMPWEEAAQNQSIGQRIGNDWSARADAVRNAPDLANFMISSARLGIGGAADIGTEALKSAYNSIPGSQYVTDAAKSAAQYIGNQPLSDDPTWKNHPTIGDAVQGYSNMASQAAKNNPTASNALGLVNDTANLAGLKGAGDMALSGINAASDALASRPIGNGLFATKVGPMSSADVKAQMTDPAYAAMRASGSALTPAATNDMLSKAEAALGRDPKISPDAADKMVETMKSGDNQTTPWANDATSLPTIQQKDTELTSAINMAYRSGDNNLARKLSNVQDALRDSVNNAAPEDITGGVGGVNSWNMGKFHFGQQADLAKIEAAVNVTQNMNQPANSLAKRFDMMLNKGKVAGWQPEEIALAQKIASDSTGQSLLRSAGGRLVNGVAAGVGTAAGTAIGGPIGAVVGGMLGGTAGHAATSIARDAAWASKMKDVDALKEMILNRKPPEPIAEPAAQAPTPQPTLALPAPGRATLSNDEIAQMRAQINNPSPKTGGVPLPEQEAAPRTTVTVRDPETGMLDHAPKVVAGNAAQNAGYQALPWIKQRQIDKLLPEYTNNTMTRPQLISQMAKIGLSPKDTKEILDSLYQAKIWRQGRMGQPAPKR